MKIIPDSINLPFISFRVVGLFISLALLALSVWSWIQAGDDKYGVDFLGGVEVVVQFEEAVSVQNIRDAVEGAGFSSAVVQRFEDANNRFSIRLKGADKNDTANALSAKLKEISPEGFSVQKQDFVGPVIGDKIRKDGLTALAVALVGILIYIAVRFEFRFAIGATVALIHDVLITTGLFIFAQHEISAAVLAALLTIVGYSLNDTIVVFDRIRENITKEVKRVGGSSKNTSESLDYHQIVNRSINETLSRTLLTSLTTFFVVCSLWLLGGGAVVELAFALVIGVVIGTYSSIFVASPVLLIGIPKRAS